MLKLNKEFCNENIMKGNLIEFINRYDYIAESYNESEKEL